MCEDEDQHTSNDEDGSMDDTNDQKAQHSSSRRQSFLQRLFGRKVPKGSYAKAHDSFEVLTAYRSVKSTIRQQPWQENNQKS